MVLTEHTFPFTVRWMEEEVMLYAELDRRRITWRHMLPGGKRSPKRPVPKALGEAGFRPEQPVQWKDGPHGKRVPIYRVPKLAIEWAKLHCQAMADERRGIAEALAARNRRSNNVRLGHLFERVRESAWYTNLSRARLDEVGCAMRWVEAELGRDFNLSGWDGDLQDRLYLKRRERGVKTTTTDGGPGFLPPSGRNTAVKDIRSLKTVFNEALRLKFREGDPRELLDSNPMAKYRLPKYGARRKREPVDHSLYETLLKYTDEVDSTGKFRFFLVLLRWLGERVSTVRRLNVDSLLFTVPEIRKALDEQLCNYVPRVAHRDRVAELYARNGGAVFYRLWMRKPALSQDEGEVEQYDAVVPIHPAIKEEFDRYYRKCIEPRELGPGAPLFPGERLDRVISERQVNLWWHDAIRLAERAEKRDLALTKGNAYHGLRYNRRTELRKVEPKYARWLIGHSVTNGTPGIEVSEGVYLGLKPRDLVAAVRASDEDEDEAQDW